MKDIGALAEKMCDIRVFEQNLMRMFSEGRLTGTTHTCIGQEAIAVAAMANIAEHDAVFSNHRCHGHFLAYGGSAEELLLEIMGKSSGICGGRGGSQHLCYRHFFTNGIQGGMVPVAVGYAMGNKILGQENVSVVFIGDGTMGEGIVYEALNMASLWSVPVLFVMENNGYAQSTPVEKNAAGDMSARFRAFGITTSEIESNDLTELLPTFAQAIEYVRTNKRPFCQIVKTYRLCPHSKGDDFRNPSEIAERQANDPLLLLQRHFSQENIDCMLANSQVKLNIMVETAIKEVSTKAWKPEIGLTKVYNIPRQSEIIPCEANLRVVDSLNAALSYALANIPNVVVLGEDILDPYGGAFKVTKGLSEKYPGKVYSTPISEAGFTGIANGLSLNGFKPVVEIMFGDFATLIYDQILNHGAKFKWMYNNQVNASLVVRVPVGGNRGYGPTHSQSIERMFFGIPNTIVVAPSLYHNPGQLLLDAIDHTDVPLIFVENKVMYGEKLQVPINGRVGKFHLKIEGKLFPTLRLRIDESSETDATILCYGYSVKIAAEAAQNLMIKDELNVEIICPSLISPVPIDDIVALISPSTKCILTVEESSDAFGWGAEIMTRIQEQKLNFSSNLKFSRIGAYPCFIPASKEMEQEVLPSAEKIEIRLRGSIR